MQAINLVPRDCLEVRQRQRRMRGWLLAFAGAGVLLLFSGLHLTVQDSRLRRFEQSRHEAEIQLADLQRQRAGLLLRRTELFDRARILVAPLDSSRLPAALARLTNDAPPGVVLNRIEVGPQPEPVTTTDGQTRTPAAPIAIEGFAETEDEVHRFTSLVRGIADWEAAQLHSIQRREAAGLPRPHFTIQRTARTTP